MAGITSAHKTNAAGCIGTQNQGTGVEEHLGNKLESEARCQCICLGNTMEGTILEIRLLRRDTAEQ